MKGDNIMLNKEKYAKEIKEGVDCSEWYKD